MGPTTAAEPQMGDIGLTQIHGEVGRLIRLGQWLNGDGFADVEHAFTYIGRGEIVEAEPGGARRAQLAEYSADTVTWLRCPERHRAAVANAAIALIGTGYSAADYFALAAHRLHLPIPWLRWYIRRSKRLICSALADRAASLGGWHLFTGVWEGYVTPGALLELARAQNAPAPWEA
jgi:hypothetical protein